MTGRAKGLVVATGCDRNFADIALNLVGSIHRYDHVVERILLYDIGMTSRQRRRFAAIEGLEVRDVEPFVPHWRSYWTWKPWVWNDASNGARRLLWLDAGTEVRGDLTPVVEAIDDVGYFAVSQREWVPGGHVVRHEVPSDWFARMELDSSLADEPAVAAAIFGFAVGSRIHTDVVVRCLELAIAGENLGWSAGDLHRNTGIHAIENPPVRDCSMFRQDQSVLNAVLYQAAAPLLVHPRAVYANPSPQPGDGTLIVHRRRKTGARTVGAVHYRRFGAFKNAKNRVRMKIKRSRPFLALRRRYRPNSNDLCRSRRWR